MAYIVPGMQLIPQTMNMSCWYASAQMVVQWRREWMQACEQGVEDPSEDPMLETWKAKNAGITDGQIVTLAKKLGLELIPPMSPTPGALEDWLFQYGPLWTNGTSHITVIAGIRNLDVLVYDPWPPNEGRIGWRSLAKWYVGNTVSSRDVNTKSGVFMHCPR